MSTYRRRPFKADVQYNNFYTFPPYIYPIVMNNSAAYPEACLLGPSTTIQKTHKVGIKWQL